MLFAAAQPLSVAALPFAWLACAAALVTLGAAVQVAIGAGLSVVSGPFLFLLLGPAAAVPVLLCLNLLVSVLATAGAVAGVRWADVALAAGTTLVGCGAALALPPPSDGTLKLVTAAVLLAVALPRPPVPNRATGPGGAVGVAGAGLASGFLTAWTATPGPILPVALAQAERSGEEIRRTMQPISIIGYGAALAGTGIGLPGRLDPAVLPWLLGAAGLGVVLGFRLRRVVPAGRVASFVRLVAAAAAVLLLASALA